MKVKNLFFISTVFALLFVSCTNSSKQNSNAQQTPSAEELKIEQARKEIKSDLEETNASLPIVDESTGIKTVSMVLDDDKVKVTYETDEMLFNLDSLSKHKEILQDMGISYLSSQKVKDSGYLQKFVDANVSIQWIMKSSKSGKALMYESNHNELKMISENSDDDITNTKKRLNATMAIANAGCPVRQDEMTVMTRAYYDGKNVIYEYLIDENEDFDMSNILIRSQLKKAMRPTLIENFKSSQFKKTIKDMFEMCIKVDANLIYKYKGRTSGQRVEVTFTPDDMSKIM